MSRARNIKPAFFKNEVLAELSVQCRLLFIGLWTLADREGRLEDRPKRIKMEIYPADQFNVDSMLDELMSNGFIDRYESGGQRFIEVLNFVKHQDPHYRERASVIPPPEGRENAVLATNVTRTQRARILDRDGHRCRHCGATSQLCIDHILPVSRGGSSDDGNLQVLCLSCNTKKGNKVGDGQPNVGLTTSLDAPLIPDSLIPDSGFLGESPEPIGSGASAPIESSHPLVTHGSDGVVADPIWGAGLAFLLRKGIPVKPARSLLGQLRKAAGDIQCGAILADAEAQDISNPAPWLMKAAANAKARGSPNGAPVGKTMQAIQALQEMKNGLAVNRDHDGVPEAALLEFGPDSGGRGNSRGGSGLV